MTQTDAQLLERYTRDRSEDAFAEIVRRHETLRTTFNLEDGEPVQVIQQPANFPLEVRDLSALSESERESETHRLVTAEAHRSA